MRALVDCNNFFVSCERVFNPSLNGIPVVVLSGNDGCIIARSNEAKALGIPMGAPAFQWREVIDRHNVKCFSGNHVLYNDMSRRIMTILAQEVDNITVYSVDEAFFDVDDCQPEDMLNQLSALAFKIEKCVGIPVSIGASLSRTLAKIASHIAKKECTESTHAYLLTNRNDVHIRLANIPVGEVWGIGRRITTRLNSIGVNTAAQFARLPQNYVRENFNVTGERTWLELHGVDCSILQAVDEKRKSITMSRTFPHPITDINSICEAIANFAHTCAYKLRNEGQIAGSVLVYAASSRFDSINNYSNSASVKLPVATADSLSIVRVAVSLMQSIFRENVGFKKAGVILNDLCDDSHRQLNLFSEIDLAKQQRLMQTIDKINDTHSGLVKIASMGSNNDWKPNCNLKSREFSTSLRDIIVVNCDK